MPEYYKAYYLRQMRAFPGWSEKAFPSRVKETGEERQGEADPHEDDSIVFLSEDLVVFRSAGGEDVVFDSDTPEWETFCRNALEFEVPDWEAESARVREELARKKDAAQ